MALRSDKYNKRLKELKNALFLLLKNSKDSRMPVSDIWNEMHKKFPSIKVAASRYGLARMKDVFDLFEDMMQINDDSNIAYAELNPHYYASDESSEDVSEDGDDQTVSFPSAATHAISDINKLRKQLLSELIALLNDYPQGIKKSEIWNMYFKKYNSQVSASTYHINKLSRILELFHPVIELKEINGIPYVVLPQTKPKTSLEWGAGAKLQQDRSQNRRDGSQNRKDKFFNVEQNNTEKFASANKLSPCPVLPLLHPVPLPMSSNSRPFLSLNTPMVNQPLMVPTGPSMSGRNAPNVINQIIYNNPVIKETQLKSTGKLQQMRGPNLSRVIHSQPIETQQVAPPQNIENSNMDLIDLTGEDDPPSKRRPESSTNLYTKRIPQGLISEEEFEESDIQVSRIRGFERGHSRPLKELVEKAAQECIEAIADSNQYVSDDSIRELLCQRFGIDDLSWIGIRYLDNISAVNEKIRAECRVNAYIQAFLKARSICTLFELSECLAEFSPDKKDFRAMKLGPLQKLPEIYRSFRFPQNIREIPEITTMDIIGKLDDYMNAENKWQAKIVCEEFMEFLVKSYGVSSPFVLGVRLRSLPLATQVLKKSKRDAARSRRGVTEECMKKLQANLESSFQKFQATLLQKTGETSYEMKSHYCRLPPEEAIVEIAEKFQVLISLDEPHTHRERQFHFEMERVVPKFMKLITTNKLSATMLHLAICVSDTTLRESDLEAISQHEQRTNDQEQESLPSANRGAVVKKLTEYLNKCVNLPEGLKLNHLDMIENKLADHFGYSSFMEMKLGRFLEFILKEGKSILEECGGTSIGVSGSSSADSGSSYCPKKYDVLEFIIQSQKAGIQQSNDIEAALCKQYGILDVKHLGHGKISRLITSASAPGKHQAAEYSVLYESALFKPQKMQGQNVGVLGSQSKEKALVCLHNCPLLEDLEEWSHWSLVFEPQYGSLKDFVQTYGGYQTIHIKDGSELITTDFLALEVRSGVLLKLTADTSVDKFKSILSTEDSTSVCGHLLSLIATSKGTENTPLDLMANHIQTALFTISESAGDDTSSEKAVKFVLQCLLKLPLKMCVALANKMFLEPLANVVGSTKSKLLLWKQAKTVKEQTRLQNLGTLLGVLEWSSKIQERCFPPACAVQQLSREEAEEFEAEDAAEEEIESVKEAIMEEDDIISLLSDGDEDTLLEEKEETSPKEDEGIGEGTQENSQPEYPEDLELLDLDAKEKGCWIIINNIRRDRFGIGMSLSEDVKKLMKENQEMLGRSLDRLSKDLYSKDTHFVLELIQNADDNDYPEFSGKMGENDCPTVKFVMTETGVVILNNECGFKEQHVRAICDVGKSTKGKHKIGYIGQKGIGFKSVFRITDTPEIHSNGFHIQFDANSGPMGFILPHWVKEKENVDKRWTTQISLPLKEGSNTGLLAARFHDIHPSILLFLNRLGQVIIDNQVEGVFQNMKRTFINQNSIEITHKDGTDRFLVTKKTLDATKISLKAKSGVEVASTQVAIAFPLSEQMSSRQPVFAFLPLRSYGFKFIVQGDFDVPSSREDVDGDSPWNQWIRNEIASLFTDSLELFKETITDPVQAVIKFLKFIPVEDEILDFFHPVSTQIMQNLKKKAWLPVQSCEKDEVLWKMPSQTVMVRDHLVMNVVTPHVLQQHLNLFYIHPDLETHLMDSSLTKSLGIGSLSTAHLIKIGKSIINDKREQLEQGNLEKEEIENFLILLSTWLASVYKSLDDFNDSTESYIQELKDMKMLPIAGSCRFVSVTNETVFFPFVNEKINTSKNDSMAILQCDLNTILPLLINTADQEVNSQAIKLLEKIGVCHISPEEVIHQHILPILRSNAWKEKSRDMVLSYVIYIKAQWEKDANIVKLEDLKNIIPLATNRGFCKPTENAIHFTPLYGHFVDLKMHFPSYQWTLLDGVYLAQTASGISRNLQKPQMKWQSFFLGLGVLQFFSVQKEVVPLSSGNLDGTQWEKYKGVIPSVPEDSYIEDFVSEEVTSLIEQSIKSESGINQMKVLFELLSRDWDKIYSKFSTAQLFNKTGIHIKDLDSSFALTLKSSYWVPAISVQYSLEPESRKIITQTEHCFKRPSEVYLPHQEIKNILAHTVVYLDISSLSPSASPAFFKMLGLKSSVTVDEAKDHLRHWGKREAQSKPAVFLSSMSHIITVYKYLFENMAFKQSSSFFQLEPVIFVPKFGLAPLYSTIICGNFFRKSEVWLDDPTALMQKYHNVLTEMHADIGNKITLQPHYQAYPDILQFFKSQGRFESMPSATEYAELLVVVCSLMTANDDSAYKDVIKLLETLGKWLCYSVNETPGMVDATAFKSVVEGQKKLVLEKLKGQDIIPTKKGQMVNLEKKPLLPDDQDLEKLFKDSPEVFFVDLDRDSRKKGKSEKTALDLNIVTHFLQDICGIKYLSKSVVTEEITQMTRVSSILQQYFYDLVPFIQKFLYSLKPHVYENHMQEGILEKLDSIQFFEVSSLEVKYIIPALRKSPSDKGLTSEVFKIQTKKCIVNTDTCHFYFHRDCIESHNDICKEFARFFCQRDDSLLRDLKNFLNELMPIILGQTKSSVRDVLIDYKISLDLPDDEPGWRISPPVIMMPPVVEEESIPEKEMMLPRDIESGASEEKTKSEKTMTSWPPLPDYPLKGSKHGTTAKANNQKSTGSGMWPQPTNRDEQTRSILSGIRVVADETQDSTVEGHNEEVDDCRESSAVVEVFHTGHTDQPLGTKNRSFKDRTEAQVTRKNVTVVYEREESMEDTGNKRKRTDSEGSSSQYITSKRISSEMEHTSEILNEIQGQRSNQDHSESHNEEFRTKTKKTALQKTENDVPVWTDLASEYSFSELASGRSLLEIPEELQAICSAEGNADTGMRGELIVYSYLLQSQKTDTSIKEIRWCNLKKESALPYDFEIDMLEGGGVKTYYIEVKSTLSDKKQMIEISSQQLKFAQSQKEMFQIYRVYCVGDADKVKLLKIDNLSLRLDQKQVKICMFI